jgi:hypothetical protein
VPWIVKTSTAIHSHNHQLIPRFKCEAEVDFYKHQVRRVPLTIKAMFFAELHVDEPEEVFLALVRTCKAEQDDVTAGSIQVW